MKLYSTRRQVNRRRIVSEEARWTGKHAMASVVLGSTTMMLLCLSFINITVSTLHILAMKRIVLTEAGPPVCAIGGLRITVVHAARYASTRDTTSTEGMYPHD